MAVTLEPFRPEDYQAVCDFLIELNRDKSHINWNWARWEWMYAHPYLDRQKLAAIGLWKSGGRIVGAAVYDLFPGEALCAALDEYRDLLPEILEYAYCFLKDSRGLGVAAGEADLQMQQTLIRLGYQKTQQTEPVLQRRLDEPLEYELPAGFRIREIRFPEDNLAYQTVIWKGFDHEGDQEELEKMLRNEAPLPVHREPYLCLAAEDGSGEFAAHCTCWYDRRTDYAYVEPVCTVPKYRGMGLGRAVVLEALRRCRELGAKTAFVISDQQFYSRLGFVPYAQYTFFRKAGEI